jgi:hypothetical protein
MNKNIAIINTFIGNSYDQKIIMLLNDLLQNYKDVNGNIYTTSMNILIPDKKFGILPIYEAKYFYGKAIVWDLITLDLALGFPNLSEVIYIHNNTIPWRDNTNISYKAWEKLFTNPKLKILISEKNIYDIFKLTWNTGDFIESINTKVIYETI